MRPTPDSSARAQLGRRLVVAVEHDPFGREARGERDVELAPTRDVEMQAFVVHESRHGDAQERLARVRDAVAERSAIRAAPRPDVGFVVDVERRAESLRQRFEVDPGDRDPTARVHGRRRGQE